MSENVDARVFKAAQRYLELANKLDDIHTVVSDGKPFIYGWSTENEDELVLVFVHWDYDELPDEDLVDRKMFELALVPVLVDLGPKWKPCPVRFDIISVAVLGSNDDKVLLRHHINAFATEEQ